MAGFKNNEIDKIDNVTTKGLLGEHDSLAYRTAEIETHVHSAGSWFGKAITPIVGTHTADRIAANVLPFQIDAGDNDWGSWIQILGSDDTPARGIDAYFDPHLMLIVAAENAVTYFIQFTHGDTGEIGYAAGQFTELAITIPDTRKLAQETKIQTGRSPANAKLWCRCLAVGETTSTLDFYLGLHEYEG